MKLRRPIDSVCLSIGVVVQRSDAEWFAISLIELGLAFTLVASVVGWGLPWTLVPGGIAAVTSFGASDQRIPATFYAVPIAPVIVLLLCLGILPDPGWFIRKPAPDA